MASRESRIAIAWAEDRGYVHTVAARMLADPVEAEDVVQDAFARLALQRVEEIEDLRAWLLVVVRRLALDRLRSAHRRLSGPADPAELAARAAEGGDPADRVTLDDEVRHALGLVLDRLTPAQRTAFLLHDIFGIPFAQVAELVGRTPGACRQLASEARRSFRGDRQPSAAAAPDPALTAIAERFAAACAGGDVDQLVSLLDPDVSGWASVEGRQVGFAEGAGPVAERLLLFLGPTSRWHLTPIPLAEGAGVLATRRSEPVGVVRLEVGDGRIRRLRAVVLSRGPSGTSPPPPRARADKLSLLPTIREGSRPRRPVRGDLIAHISDAVQSLSAHEEEKGEAVLASADVSGAETHEVTVNDLVAFLVELAALVILCLWGFRTGSHLTTDLLLGVGVPALAITAWALFAAPRSTYDVLALEIAVKVTVLGGAALASFTLLPTGLAVAFAAVVAINTVLLYVGPFAR